MFYYDLVGFYTYDAPTWLEPSSAFAHNGCWQGNGGGTSYGYAHLEALEPAVVAYDARTDLALRRLQGVVHAVHVLRGYGLHLKVAVAGSTGGGVTVRTIGRHIHACQPSGKPGQPAAEHRVVVAVFSVPLFPRDRCALSQPMSVTGKIGLENGGGGYVVEATVCECFKKVFRRHKSCVYVTAVVHHDFAAETLHDRFPALFGHSHVEG